MKQVRCIRAITEALQEEMARDENVFIIGEDVGAGDGAFSATRGLLQQFGSKRVIDTPISESGMATIGIMTERTEPRNRKMTSMTMSRVSVRVFRTSLMALLIYSVAS